MLQDGALLCFKGINKGDMSNFRLISETKLLCQLFVQNLVKILKTFHFVQKCTHLECQWNVFPIYTKHCVAMETGIFRTFSPKVGHVKIYDLWI